MTTERTRLLDKVRALLSKTMGAGCTEAEALSALAKARAMIDAYEISDEELQLTKEEKAVIRPDLTGKDKYGVRDWFDRAISEFTDTKCWSDSKGITTWCGLPSDVDFAQWLSAHLDTFVRGELANHLASEIIPPYRRRRMINGFVMGCGNRISARLRELIRKPADAALNAAIVSPPRHASRALVLANIKREAIKSVMLDAGIKLRSTTARRVSNVDSYAAGHAAGDRATFARPVGGGVAGRLK